MVWSIEMGFGSKVRGVMFNDFVLQFFISFLFFSFHIS
jgi:hypothetical protein